MRNALCNQYILYGVISSDVVAHAVEIHLSTALYELMNRSGVHVPSVFGKCKVRTLLYMCHTSYFRIICQDRVRYDWVQAGCLVVLLLHNCLLMMTRCFRVCCGRELFVCCITLPL
jgi:hypothetical protein